MEKVGFTGKNLQSTDESSWQAVSIKSDSMSWSMI